MKNTLQLALAALFALVPAACSKDADGSGNEGLVATLTLQTPKGAFIPDAEHKRCYFLTFVETTSTMIKKLFRKLETTPEEPFATLFGKYYRLPDTDKLIIVLPSFDTWLDTQNGLYYKWDIVTGADETSRVENVISYCLRHGNEALPTVDYRCPDLSCPNHTAEAPLEEIKEKAEKFYDEFNKAS